MYARGCICVISSDVLSLHEVNCYFMSKKILTFIMQVLVAMIGFTSCMWLFQVIFDKESGFGIELLVQGLIFAIIYVPLAPQISRYRNVR